MARHPSTAAAALGAAAPDGLAPPSPGRLSAAMLGAARAVNRYHAARIGRPLPVAPAHEA